MTLLRNDDWRASTTHTCPAMPDAWDALDDILHSGPILISGDGAKKFIRMMQDSDIEGDEEEERPIE